MLLPKRAIWNVKILILLLSTQKTGDKRSIGFNGKYMDKIRWYLGFES